MTEFWKKTIEFVATTIGQSAVDAFGQSSVVSENISRLRATLPRARLQIERSECWRFKCEQIDELLLQLREAVYEAENRLDEYKYKKRRLERANWGIPGMLIYNVTNWVSRFPVKVMSAGGKLEHVCDESERMCIYFDVPKDPNQFGKTARPITSSDHPKIYGRHKELADAIRLLRVSRLGSGKIAILPIVGMGGIGKTTLAQMIYKDKVVQSYFDLRIWICVSDKFDLERLTKEIMECATGKECNLTNFNKIEEKSEENLKSKRVLLVLDDIWSKDWQRLLGPINEASEGSAIILTTRDPKHVECTRGDMTILDTIRLEGLEKTFYWDFFRSCAGLEIASQNDVQLEDIAREICSRLKGSPLAAITLGGLLRKGINKPHWINIRDSKLWELKQGEHDIMPALQFSYWHLPPHLRKCFSYCSLYPKGHEFTGIELAKFWIMQGFIEKEDNLKHMEDLAMGYFHDLKNSCFFHSKVINNKTSEKYVIHDLMHDVCQSITKDECYCLEDENFGKISVDVLHMSVFQKKPNTDNLREMHQFEKLQSLVASPNCGFRAIESLFTVLMSIRCLSLSRCKINNNLENIGNLKHLQYLDISQTQIQKLPDSFCTLYNLQHLDMSGCNKILGFPDDSSKLTNLQFFRPPLHLVPSLTDMPNLMRAMQLYDLTYEVGKDGMYKIEDIKHLIGVRGFLHIRGLKNVSRKEAAEEAELNKQEYLDTLHLYWYPSWNGSSEDPGICTEVLECLRPHSNLRVLGIFEYNGQDLSPSWMGDDLPNLRSVLFDDCSNYTLPLLPRSITELQIKSNQRLTSLQACLRPNLLPKLKCLEITWCPELVSLPVESFCEFVSLEKLTISCCYKLKCPGKMVLPPSIKLLLLRSIGELENSIPSCLKNLTSLEDLELEYCPHLESIPSEVMRNLKSLRRLYVKDCGNLRSLGDEEFLESINDLKIVLCHHELKITRGRNPDGMKLSGALGAAAPSSSHTIPPEPQMPLIETPITALDEPTAAAPSSPDTITSYPRMQSIEAPSTDIPSSSNSRKRKAESN